MSVHDDRSDAVPMRPSSVSVADQRRRELPRNGILISCGVIATIDDSNDRVAVEHRQVKIGLGTQSRGRGMEWCDRLPSCDRAGCDKTLEHCKVGHADHK